MNHAKIKEACEFLKSNGIVSSNVAIVLGTGLGNLVAELSNKVSVNYSEIPHFPESTVEYHSGKFIQGDLCNKKVILLQGRFHFYEGHSMQDIVFPIRVFYMLGVKNLILSNAAGALNLNFKKGSLMLIKDHVDLFPDHPLIGKNDDFFGVRFPDMSETYNFQLIELLKNTAKDLNISLEEGVYIAAQGPMLESPAEYRMLKKLGGDAVGMSTIPEAIAARHMGIKCCGISILTDECDPDNLSPIDINEIIDVASKAEKKLIQLMKAFVPLVDEDA